MSGIVYDHAVAGLPFMQAPSNPEPYQRGLAEQRRHLEEDLLPTLKDAPLDSVSLPPALKAAITALANASVVAERRHLLQLRFLETSCLFAFMSCNAGQGRY